MNHLELEKKEILNILNGILNVPGSFGILNNLKKEKALKDKLEKEFSVIWKLDKKDTLDSYPPLLDLCFKQLIKEIIQPIDKDFIKLYNCLDLALYCTEIGYADPSLPFTLIEDILEVVIIDESEKIFDYLEDRVDRLTVNMLPTKGKGLILLRFCNELLRRVSKTENTVLCGKILMFLASVFPLTERSGVNLRGDFDSDNKTDFENKKSIGTIDINSEKYFYELFWNTQKYLNYPLLIFQKKEFDIFEKSINKILSELKKIDSLGRRDSDGFNKHKKTKSSHENNTANEVFNFFYSKYLTGKNIFELELSDPYFRKQILVQIFIVLQFLSSLSPKEKQNMQNHLTKMGKQIIQNKSIQYQYTLTDEQVKWVKNSKDLVQNLLEVIEPGGHGFIKTIKYILKHEKNMVKWKAESCKSYEKQAAQLQNKMKRQKTTNIPIPQFNSDISNPVLKALFKESTENDLTSLSDASRNVVPTIENYLEPLKDDIEFEIDPQDRCTANSEFCWKALRIASKHHLNIIQKCGKVDVESFYTQLMKEKEQSNKQNTINNKNEKSNTELKDDGNEVENEDIDNSVNENNSKELGLESSINETSEKGMEIESETVENSVNTFDSNNDSKNDEKNENSLSISESNDISNDESNNNNSINKK
ncbi:hypothetical protein BCR36DRAFT_579443 [Piromyces finnis]|uniref:THO complex subunit 1 transcription elongation factor n=1 Tax=Piromyces finnis TaxID=1754191 RepID=A0A1Y1VM38_9FUNG|nr:hypothetical protein BCR36DRAFT_579443 [Piromyces finnis]|eukprot:ORX59995.1 hypothetical protein BCR36DRAFT_579443 [Piromyces finnis]